MVKKAKTKPKTESPQDELYKEVRGYKVKIKKSQIEKRLTNEEERTLIDSIVYDTHKNMWERNRAIIVFLLNTGLRVSEFQQLVVSDVMAMNGKPKSMLDVRPSTAKRKKPRHVPLNNLAKESIVALLKGREELSFNDPLTTKDGINGLSRRAIQEVVHTASLKAGINRQIFPHTLRHTFLSKIYSKTGNLKITQTLAGHSNSKLTMDLYVHTTVEEMEDAVSLIVDDKEV